MKKKEYKYIEHVQMTCGLLYLSFSQLQILSNISEPKEVKFVSGAPFSYFAVALQYMLTMELVKLLEKGTRPDQNVASLYKLNRHLFSELGEEFKDYYEKNLHDLDAIAESKTFKTVLNNRHTRFGHCDSSNTNPGSIKALTLEQLEDIGQIIEAIKTILNRCTKVSGNYDFHFDDLDNRLKNLIKFETIYNEFYYKNLKLAYEQGFKLW